MDNQKSANNRKLNKQKSSINWKSCFRLLLGLAMFSVLFFYFDPKEILKLLYHVDWSYVALTLFLCCCVMALRAWRWKWVLKDLGMDAGFFSLFEIIMVSNYFNTFLPGSLGGDLYRVYGLSQESAKKLRPIATVIIERLTGLLALVVVCLIALIIYWDILPPQVSILAWLCIAIAAGLLIGFFCIGFVEKFWHGLNKFLPEKIAGKIPEEKITIIFVLIRELHKKRKVYIRSFLNGLLLQAFVIYTYYTASLALEHSIPLYLFFVFFPLVELAGMIPLTINGFGIKEGLLIYFMEWAQVSPSYSMSLSILYRFIFILLAVIGGILFFSRKPKQKDNRSIKENL